MLDLKSKKGLEAKILIEFILVLIGFAIILIAFFGMDWGKQVDTQACHESVIARMTLPDTPFKSAKEIVPLNCKTQRICVTSKIFGEGNLLHCLQFLKHKIQCFLGKLLRSFLLFCQMPVSMWKGLIFFLAL